MIAGGLHPSGQAGIPRREQHPAHRRSQNLPVRIPHGACRWAWKECVDVSHRHILRARHVFATYSCPDPKKPGLRATRTMFDAIAAGMIGFLFVLGGTLIVGGLRPR